MKRIDVFIVDGSLVPLSLLLFFEFIRIIIKYLYCSVN